MSRSRLVCLILAISLLSGAGAAPAQDTGWRQPPKDTSLIPPGGGAGDGREGGEAIADAFPITTVPFSDTGNTCDNLDDYDEACPYTDSTAPDVVYVFTPAENMLVEVDLCGSSYDTKTYIYCESAGNLVACNDDFYFDDICGIFVSRIGNATLFAGLSYYIVVDGYGDSCGDYALLIQEQDTCDLVCPPGGVSEGEPPLVDYYVDQHNGGCNSDPEVFQVLEANDADDCVTVCGRSGWYWAGTPARDTDWYEIYAIGSPVSIDLDAEFPVNFFVLNTNCGNLQLLYELTEVGPCWPQALVFPTAPGDVYWLWVGPTAFEGPASPFEFDYQLQVCGIFSSIPVNQVSWGQLKSLFW